MAQWMQLRIIPVEKVADAADQVSKVIAVFRTALNIVMKALNIAKVFLIDITNPIKPIVQALVAYIENLIKEFSQPGGIKILPIIPFVGGLPLQACKGGISKFNTTFIASLTDTADDARPQFTSYGGAFVVLVDDTNAGLIFELIKRFTALIQIATPSMPSPVNVRAWPATSKGVAITSATQLLKKDSGVVGVRIDWNMSVPSGAKMADAFIPHMFRIERSQTKDGTPFLIDKTVYNAAGQKVVIKQQVYDDSNHPIMMYDRIADILPRDPKYQVGGRFGFYKYLDKIGPGTTYFYRVRGLLGNPPEAYDVSAVKDGVWKCPEGLIGPPSVTIEAFLPVSYSSLEDDPVKALSDTIYAALILGFAEPYQTTPMFAGQGIFSTAYPWCSDFRYYPPHNPVVSFYSARLTTASKIANAMATKVVRSETLFNLFWTAYINKKYAVSFVAAQGGMESSYPWYPYPPYTDPDVASYRSAVNSVLTPLMGAMSLRGEPPNWISAFPSYNLIPNQVFALLRRIEAEALGLLAAFDGIVTDILNYIDLIEKRVDAINELIDFIQEIIDMLKQFKFPGMWMLYVPFDDGGVAGVVERYLAATDGPTPNDMSYTAGIVCMMNDPILGAFFAMLSGGEE
jgi:hypothetical protein